MNLRKYEKSHTQYEGYTCVGYGSNKLEDFTASQDIDVFIQKEGAYKLSLASGWNPQVLYYVKDEDFREHSGKTWEGKLMDILKKYPEAEDALLELHPQDKDIIRPVGLIFEDEEQQTYQIFYAFGGEFQLMNMETYYPVVVGDMREIRTTIKNMSLTRK